ncbi:Hypothetical protein SRAE_X000212500 [Strongyloides ratti]|uniref:C2H2-type domain-containing protein n=1 Tax=Strongyloides ratti TaxID=34506 RepID=A0A090KWY8_STRRB|nr:Hypothetical protein SRAE_X000212500 [Strongyloides ratti]CEF60387.1 Hypothetical protein SRAE_X000212500 [Strongyloides ratti]
MDDNIEEAKIVEKNCLYCGILAFFEEQLIEIFYINNVKYFFYVCDNCIKSGIENMDNTSDVKEKEQISFQYVVENKSQPINRLATNFTHYTSDNVKIQHICHGSRAYKKLRSTFVDRLLSIKLSIQEMKLLKLALENEQNENLFDKYIITKTQARKELKESGVKKIIQVQECTKTVFKAMLKQISSHTKKIKKMSGEYRLDIKKLGSETYRRVFNFTSECNICKFNCTTPKKMIEHVLSIHLSIKNCALLKCVTCIKHFSFSKSFLDFYTINRHYANCNYHGGERFKNNLIQSTSDEREIFIYIDKSYGFNILVDYEKTFDLCFSIPDFIPIKP